MSRSVLKPSPPKLWMHISVKNITCDKFISPDWMKTSYHSWHCFCSGCTCRTLWVTIIVVFSTFFRPTLCGHVFKFQDGMSARTVCEWASLENRKNNFPPVDLNDIIRIRRIFIIKSKRAAQFSVFEWSCKKVLKFRTYKFTAPSTSQ